ncbi:SRPBCC family protein [Allokutzneria sp. A3M-2-11 16]|uniref:SRPBCC family protein n=1 Tax=Allokutzneria sp. A3M-2-11 16 TaxID=2962043 RepID=UPI0020B84654|nr:SRPBCC family protein [Allokutzneria sp. A3M-2-11 16]MCP3798366.1 SRPBCC family protein [Allokutzneria sp. A3M-2-11 16]
MNRTPTGRLFGTDLVLDRTFRAPIDDVWASVTDSERTARWFGPWKGEAAPGRTIQVQMAFEEQQPWCDLHIDACSPPQNLAVSMKDEAGNWRLELALSEKDGVTTLRLTHHLESVEGVGEVGPGWEYYLDMLVAAREGSAQPDFTDYYPAMKPYFEDQRQAVSHKPSSTPPTK